VAGIKVLAKEEEAHQGAQLRARNESAIESERRRRKHQIRLLREVPKMNRSRKGKKAKRKKKGTMQRANGSHEKCTSLQ
jgi:hypothetical protein